MEQAAQSLAGKVALITGGGRGQGAAEARLFAASGAAVMICDVLEAEGRAVAESIGADAARFQLLDVGDPAGWKEAVAAVLDWRGRLDILVNNAGIIDRSTIMGMGLESWNRVLGVNLTGAFLGIKAAAPAMRDGGRGGAVVNIASHAGFSAHSDPAYTASKWALRGLTRTAAMEFVSWGIRVNSVCPGLIVTEMNAGSPHLRPLIELTPMGRAGTVDEIARLVRFLASDEASFITGDDFVADGGFIAGAAYRRVAVEAGLLPPVAGGEQAG
jgi:3alpha(or 20beta)-hydroxysteroid dehydrogenase